MAENVTLNNLSNLQNESSAVNTINSNNSAVTNAFRDVMSLSGVQPNAMNANIDMNSNRIMNLSAPINGTEPLRLLDAALFQSGGSFSVPSNIRVQKVITSSYNPSSTDDIIVVESPTSITIGLASISGSRAGRPLTIVDALGIAGTSSITITHSENIDGISTSIALKTNYQEITLYPFTAGGGWFVEHSFPGVVSTGTVIGNSTGSSDIPRASSVITLSTTPTYNLVSSSIASVFNIPLNSSSITVPANKELLLMLIGSGGEGIAGNTANTYTVGTSGEAVGLSIAMTLGAGSDATSECFINSLVGNNAGPGTLKTIHAGATGQGTSTGGLFAVNAEITPVATTTNLSAMNLFGSLNSTGVSPVSIGVGLESNNGDLYQYGLLGGTATALPVNLGFVTWFAASNSGANARFLQLLNSSSTEIFYVDKTGKLSSTSGIFSTNSSVGIGYATGAGSSVTQSVSKSTGVTLNNISGKITMNNAALASSAQAVFTVSNTCVSSGDVVIVNLANGNAISGNYIASIDTVINNAFNIKLYNNGTSSAGDAVVVNFAIIKSAIS